MDPIKQLAELVSINSVFPNEKKKAEYLEKKLQELGFGTKRIPVAKGRFNVVGERGCEGKPILFYAHIDTVPAYGEWKSDPWKLREEGDMLYSLGAYDMQAGIAAILSVCKENTGRRIKIAFGVDEENNSDGAWAIAKDGFFDDAEIAIVPEINDSELQMRRADWIMLGKRGRAEYDIDVPGQTGHAARVKDGVSAIDEAAKLTIEFGKMNSKFKGKGLFPPPSQFIRKIEGKATSLSLPENASIVLDRHMVPPENAEIVLGKIRKEIREMYRKGVFKCKGRKIEVRIKPRASPYLEPYYTPKENRHVQLLQNIVGKEVGKPVLVYGMSTADECVIASRGVPVITYGACGGNAHKADEWVSRKSLLDVVKVLGRFIESA
ncbi:MAG: M20/M25/M40 family metallo-hydrolase [Candidatus Micrarchaeota archaeon]